MITYDEVLNRMDGSVQAQEASDESTRQLQEHEARQQHERWLKHPLTIKLIDTINQLKLSSIEQSQLAALKNEDQVAHNHIIESVVLTQTLNLVQKGTYATGK